MKLHAMILCALGVGAVVILAAPTARADDELVQTVGNLLADKDPEVRAVGLEQVRDGLKGTAATRHFAELLPKLAPPAQAGLLAALAARGDAAAKPAVIAMIQSPQAEVRAAAILALGSFGDRGDVPQIIELLGKADTAQDAAAAAMWLRGEGVGAALYTATKQSPPEVRAKAFQLLAARHAVECVPSLIEAAQDANAAVRTAAFAALGQLATAEYFADLARLVLKAPDDATRDAAEKAIMLASQRIPEVDQRADALLVAMEKMSQSDQTALLSTLGRVGGRKALAVVEAAMSSQDADRREIALRALCNWPDGSVGPRLLKIAQSDDDAAHRKRALDALIRVAPLPDKRPDAQRLEMLEKAMQLCTRDAQKELILKRARAIRSLATLRFVAPYLDDPKFAQAACETVVELAHHKELRQPNKAEFDKFLDKVIATSKDRTVVERAQRYQKDLTWTGK